MLGQVYKILLKSGKPNTATHNFEKNELKISDETRELTFQL